MEKMKMMQEKFLMLAEKLNVSPMAMDQIKEGFEKDNEEYDKKVEKVEEKVEGKNGDVKVNIIKDNEVAMPSDEEIEGMDKDALIIFAKGMIKKPVQNEDGKNNEQKHSPYIMMMKKQGY